MIEVLGKILLNTLEQHKYILLRQMWGIHHSVATLLDAIAEPQPNVLKQLSMMLPSSSTWMHTQALRISPHTFCKYAALHELQSLKKAWTQYIHLDLKLHHISAGGSSYKTSSHRGICFVERAHVPWLLIVIYNLHEVGNNTLTGGDQPKSSKCIISVLVSGVQVAKKWICLQKRMLEAAYKEHYTDRGLTFLW